MATEAVLRRKTRASVGHSTDAILTDPLVDDYLDNALEELNRMQPLHELESFSTEADVQTYTYTVANVSADRLDDPVVFWDGGLGGAGCSSLQLFGNFDSPLSLILNEMLYGRRIEKWQIDRVTREYSTLVHYFSGKGGNLIGDGQIWLDPMPGSVVTVYHLTPVPRFSAVTDVDARFMRALLKYAEYGAATYLAGKQSELKSVQSDAGKDVSTMGGTGYAKQAAAAYTSFYNLARVPSPVPGTASMGRTRQYR